MSLVGPQAELDQVTETGKTFSFDFSIGLTTCYHVSHLAGYVMVCHVMSCHVIVMFRRGDVFGREKLSVARVILSYYRVSNREFQCATLTLCALAIYSLVMAFQKYFSLFSGEVWSQYEALHCQGFARALVRKQGLSGC